MMHRGRPLRRQPGDDVGTCGAASSAHCPREAPQSCCPARLLPALWLVLQLSHLVGLRVCVCCIGGPCSCSVAAACVVACQHSVWVLAQRLQAPPQHRQLPVHDGHRLEQVLALLLRAW